MKVQFFGGNTFRIEGKNATFAFDPHKPFAEELDFITHSEAMEPIESKAKKILGLPGEFEISNVLINGVFSAGKNVIFKSVADEICSVHFGSLIEEPKAKVLELLGENIDVMFVNLSEKFTPKQAKKLIETISPRYAFVGGVENLFGEMVKDGATIEQDEAFIVSKSALVEEKTDIVKLPISS